jgi:hypothetical protein
MRGGSSSLPGRITKQAFGMAAVFLDEIEELDEEDHVILTGLFSGSLQEEDRVEEVEALAFDEALAWARSRAERIYVDVENERYSAGALRDPGLPPLPRRFAARAAGGRRRPIGDEWIDRAEDEPAITWQVIVEVSPDKLDRNQREAQEQVVGRVVRGLAEVGCGEIAWDADSLDAGLDDIDRQAEAQSDQQWVPWFTSHALAFTVRALFEASTHRVATTIIRDRAFEELKQATGREPYEAGAATITGRWGLDVQVHPPGYVPPPRPV